MPWSESSWEKGTASFGLHLGAFAFKLIVPPMKIAKTANSKGGGGSMDSRNTDLTRLTQIACLGNVFIRALCIRRDAIPGSPIFEGKN